MGRPCGPCHDPRRIEIDRRLLNKEISGETFRLLSSEFGFSEIALRRHLARHLTVDLAAVQAAKEDARQKALAEAHDRELEAVKADMRDSTAARLENCENFFDQLRIIREAAAKQLDKAEGADDPRGTLAAIRELRELVRLWAEIDGKIRSQQINVVVDIYSSPQWIEAGRALAEILEPESPELRRRVAERLHALAEASR
ncbi:MAG: hypothetical protein A4E45_01759 [Methanosaeta sp. PtaB.Bin039]|nr:MAG: hypothetical protein A4E45_01759 [Methanosaeta sp. PtaB.Bin039]